MCRDWDLQTFPVYTSIFKYYQSVNITLDSHPLFPLLKWIQSKTSSVIQITFFSPKDKQKGQKVYNSKQ